MAYKRRYPIGPELTNSGAHFRVWAPERKKVTLVVDHKEFPLKKEKNGYFSNFIPHLKKETRYAFKLDNLDSHYPDPASHYQPDGVEGASCLVDHYFPWTDSKWPGVALKNQIIYEMHIGTYTPEGTFKAAAKELSELAHLGITLIEVMPINEFPGKFGWGYDGIHLFAPYHVYGSPEDVKMFVNEAHRLGMGVILDVVYNHFGPEGNFFSKFSSHYFNHQKTTEWGDAINFDNLSCREYFLTNAKYWIENYHFDGLRVDATPWFFCETEEHVLSELTNVVKNSNPKKKKVVIGENEEQNTILLKSYKQKGYGFDALWNDDFHHTALVRLKGKREAYYSDYLGTPQEFISSLKFGFLYQGQYYNWQKKLRGTPSLNFPPASFVTFLENHDQVANSGKGKHLHELCDPGNYRAMSALLLLGPNTPLIFQGQEFGSSKPFYYFADHNQKLNILIEKGRKKFLSQFPHLTDKDAKNNLPKPGAIATFQQCKLDLRERDLHKEHYALYKDLIRLRKEDEVFKMQNPIEGAILDDNVFVLRFFSKQRKARLLILNFGEDKLFSPCPEPLLAPPENCEWKLLWSSQALSYGGEGIVPLEFPIWNIPGHSATVFKSELIEKI